MKKNSNIDLNFLTRSWIRKKTHADLLYETEKIFYGVKIWVTSPEKFFPEYRETGKIKIFETGTGNKIKMVEIEKNI